MQERVHLTIKLEVEWLTGPFWLIDDSSRPEEDGVSGPYEVEEIGELVALSDELRGEIAAWNDWFQGTLDLEVGQNSGFKSDAERQRFDEEGRILARKLRAEVPASIVVCYVPLQTGESEEITRQD